MGRRGRVIARAYVVRAPAPGGYAYIGRPSFYDASPIVFGPAMAREFATADEAREEIGCRVLLGRAEPGTWKVYRRGRRV